jgi:hypothetical protein
MYCFEFTECPSEKVEVYSVTYGNTSCEQI